MKTTIASFLTVPFCKGLKPLAALTAAQLITLPCFGILTFDFGTQNLQSELDNRASMSLAGEVANDGNTGIYAQITRSTPYTQGSGSDLLTSGSVEGDIRINQLQGTRTTFTLSLYEDQSFTTLYNPAGSYSYDLTFFDIDGNNAFYDEITVFTMGLYEIKDRAQGGQLTLTPNPNGSLTVSGQGTIPQDVPGQTGLTSLLAEENADDVAIVFTFTDVNQVTFEYNVTDNPGPTVFRRNLLIDANNLTFDGTGIPTEGGAVPEPSSYWLLGIAALAFVLRKRNS